MGIIEPKDKNYCANCGDRVAGMDEMLMCTEANDKHVEEHTIGEFIEWCENGRTDKSGKWTSKGTGKYFEGGVAAGGQMVDQRFCPRDTGMYSASSFLLNFFKKQAGKSSIVV